MLQPIDTNEKYPHWQSLINVAYERWAHGGDLEGKAYEEFVRSLDDISAYAVTFQNLNYQVENGGFSQWYQNRFYSDIDTILQGLVLLGTATAVCEVMIDVVGTMDYYESLTKEYKSAARHADHLSDFLDTFEEMCDKLLHKDLSELDARYMTYSSLLMDEIEAYFAGTAEGKEALEKVRAVHVADVASVGQ